MISVEVIMLLQASKAPWGCGEVDDMKIGMTKKAPERLGEPSYLHQRCRARCCALRGYLDDRTKG